MGRTNKLVDGCYSFWQGGLFPLLRMLMPECLAQTHIPVMPRMATAADPGDGSSSGRDAASSGHKGDSGGHGAASSGSHAGSSGNDAADSWTQRGEVLNAAAGTRDGAQDRDLADVMRLEGQEPVACALNDLHRTKVCVSYLLSC